MLNEVIQTIKKYNMIEKGDKIIIGLSGGSDSVVLFHLLRQIKNEYNLKLKVIHINHGLRLEADNDEEFCIELCKKYNIPIKVYKADIKKISKDMKITTEEAGRLFRYKCFNENISSIKDKIAVAHNKNDVVETFLMRVLRGSGLRGLSSIQPKRENIIRPLIEIEKNKIESYCDENNFQFVFDKSNLSLEYTRNKVRLNLIPLLKKEYNKEIINSIYKASEIISEEEKYLEELTEKFFEQISRIENNKIYLDATKLKTSNIVMQRRVFRSAIYRLNNNYKHLSYGHIEQCISIINSQNGTSYNLPENIRVIKAYSDICVTQETKNNEKVFKNIDIDNIYYIKEKNIYVGLSKENTNSFKSYKNYSEIQVNDLKCIKEKQLSVNNYNNLVLRNRIASDKIYFKHINGNKKIKKYFIDEKVPREDRENIILLAEGSDIFLILDEQLKIADDYAKNSVVYLKIWEEN